MSLFRILCFVSISTATLAACGAPVFTDAGFDAGDVTSSDASAVDGTAVGCLGGGTASVSVMLDLAPGLDVARGDVWVAAMCLVDGQERAVRIVHAEPTGAPTEISGLGAGSYVIRASAVIAQGAASSRLDLRDGSTSITSLTLAPGNPPIALLDAMPGSADAGANTDAATDATSFSDASTDVASDGSTSAMDASASDASVSDANPSDVGASDFDAGTTGMLILGPVVRPGTTEIVGTAAALLHAHDGASFDVRVFVRANYCATQCNDISLDSVELRTDRAGDPLDYAVMTFDTTSLSSGAVASTRAQTLVGSLADFRLGFGAAVFGQPPVVPDAGALVRDR